MKLLEWISKEFLECFSKENLNALDDLEDAYLTLLDYDPNHKLLKFATFQEGFFKFNGKYGSTYVKPTDEKRHMGYRRYTQDLKDAYARRVVRV